MANAVVADAERFLEPMFKRESYIQAKSASIVDRIYMASEGQLDTGISKEAAVVSKALQLLEAIHESIFSDQSLTILVLETSSSRRIIDALLDLISLEGIYPALLPGVGVPIERRVRSILQGGTTVADAKEPNDTSFLNLSALSARLYAMLRSCKGISVAIEQRTLVDLIATVAQLAYSPDAKDSAGWSSKLDDMINSLSPSILYPSLISLLHPTTPDWLRPRIAVPISLLPMRSVRETITFVARSTPQRPAQNIDESTSRTDGPVLPLEVLMQVSKLLSAVPSTVSAKEYFSKIGPQLLALLDDRDIDAKRAATYTVSHGILSKRQYGEPGAPGWQTCAEPLLSIIKPSSSVKSTGYPTSGQLLTAIKHLKALLLTLPNPSLSKRLLRPVILPLWSIACASRLGSEEYELILQILKHYIDAVAGSRGLLIILNDLMYDGEDDWIYSLQQASRAFDNDIHARVMFTTRNKQTLPDPSEVSKRCQLLMQLINACRDDKEIGKFFAAILEKSLQSNKPSSAKYTDDTQALANAIIARDMIATCSSRILSEASSIVSVMQNILLAQIDQIQPVRTGVHKSITRSSLATIVTSEKQQSRAERIDQLESTLSICLPCLLILLQHHDDGSTTVESIQTATLVPLLQTLLSSSLISPESKASIKLVQQLIASADGETLSKGANETDRETLDLNLYTTAMSHLQASEPPIRVQGLTQLGQLVARGSKVVTIPSITLTVIPLLSDQDSFVYLTTIRSLVTLAKTNSEHVLKTLLEAYQDVTEQSTVDVRLRIGEGLQTIIEELGTSIPSLSIPRLVAMLLSISSRRVSRARTYETQKRAAALPRTEDTDPELEDGSDEDPDIVKDRTAERDLQSILDSWQHRSGEEDLRVRASALTILGTMFENADFTAMSPYLVATLEVVSAIMTKETGQENAILRRSAVLIVLAMVKGQENAQGEGNALLVAGVEDHKTFTMDAITSLLEAVAVGDNDEIVRGHAENVIQAVKEWKEEAFDKIIRGDGIRFGLTSDDSSSQLRGLEVNSNLEPQKALKPKIEEID